ncbi:MAG: guanylate kinase [Bacilli bacterium]|nr:guanylate kinase [Bacilli bacterium]
MIKTRKKGYLIVISGPSGAGKGTICSSLLKRNEKLIESVSMTTRPKREYEIEGTDYFFTTKEDFERKISDDYFLEFATVHNNEYYGTPRKDVEDKLKAGYNVILEIDIQGAIKIKEKIEDALYIFILPPSMKELKNRLVKRGTESEEKILARFKTAYQEINEINKYNYVVVNDILEDAVAKVEAILVAETCRVDRIEELDVGNMEEVIHEDLIK